MNEELKAQFEQETGLHRQRVIDEGDINTIVFTGYYVKWLESKLSQQQAAPVSEEPITKEALIAEPGWTGYNGNQWFLANDIFVGFYSKPHIAIVIEANGEEVESEAAGVKNMNDLRHLCQLMNGK